MCLDQDVHSYKQYKQKIKVEGLSEDPKGSHCLGVTVSVV